MQNLRIPKANSEDFRRLVQQEVAGRLPYSVAEAELQFLEAADVRHGEATLREVIVLACHRPVLAELLKTVERCGLRPVAVDIEPAAVLRGYMRQFRREEDQSQRVIFVHIGYSKTAVVIAEGDHPLFIKYVEIGGRHLDLAVARHLKMDPIEAAALRRHNGDRRADRQDEEITASIGKAIRPVVEKLAGELSMCVRYHSVTFRGKPLARMLAGGGEATPEIMQELAQRLDLKYELGHPLRSFDAPALSNRPGQWDVAAGLALKPLES
jgi:type IV pilus assembly protein PilM